MTKRKVLDQPSRMTISQIMGACMLVIGILTLIITSLYTFIAEKPDGNTSSLIAIGFFLVMLGIAFFYPDMLKSESKNSVSAMRVTIYMIVSVFVFLCVKIGWTCASFKEFQLDTTWAYILGMALGSKALQSLGENKFLQKTQAAGADPFSLTESLNQGGADPFAEHHSEEPKALPAGTPPPPSVLNTKIS